MRSRFFVAVVACVLLSSAAALPAHADTVSDTKAEGARIAARKDRLREQQEVLAEKVNAATVELDLITKDVGVAQVQLGEQDKSLADLNAQAVVFAVNSYTRGSVANGLDAVLSPGGVGDDGAQRAGYAAFLLGGTVDVSDQIKAVHQDTDRLKTTLVAKQKRQDELKTSLQKNQEQIAVAQVQLDALAKQNDAALAQAIRDAEAAQERAAQAAAAAAIRQQSENFRQGQESGPAVNPAPASAQPLTVPAAKPKGKPTAAAPGKPAAAEPSPAKTPIANAPATTAAPKPKPAPRPVVQPPSVSGAAGKAVAAAYSQLGVPYVFATSSPGVSFDCSGLTSWAWSQAGVSIPRTSQAQWAALPHVALDQIQPGDLIFFYSDVHHVGIYVGNGTIIHAPYTGSTVSTSGISGSVIGAARPG